jgi:hypothetical protein
MTGVNVKSEIGPLKKVILHRPGRELLHLTPDTLERLLFDAFHSWKSHRRSMTSSPRFFAAKASRSSISRILWLM